jgi:ppGpp synthetase/RelA/SpoT-type nucleotidyltranferase
MDSQYTISEIDNAGNLLTQDPQNENALAKLNYWRALNTRFLHDIIAKTSSCPIKNIDKQKKFSISISSRPKRTTSIINKLQRLPRLKLSQIQDIVGIRYVITPQNIQVNDSCWFTDFITKQKEYLSNYFTIKKTSDYINQPRETGYRAIHFVLEYKNTEQPEFNNLQFELQIRTHYQHIWAMAVETVDMVYGKSLKISKENDPDGWSDFFRYASALISCRENMPMLEIHPQKNKNAIRDELLRLGQEKTFFTKLSMISQIVENQSVKNHDYWLLEVNIKNRTSRALGFKADALENAIALYEAREQNPDCLRGDANVVLVSAQGFRDIREAYPSYFLNIKDFLELISSEK